MRKTALFLLLILLVTAGCLRKEALRREFVRGMEERPNPNWIMVGERLRQGDTVVYCLEAYHGKRKNHPENLDRQCRKWTVTARDDHSLTLELEMEHAPSEIRDIRRTYVVDRKGYVLEAKAFSSAKEKEWTIRIAGGSEASSLDGLVTADRFTAEDTAVVDRYTRAEGNRRLLMSDELGPVEVVPVKAVYRPDGRRQMIEYYLTSDLSPFGYVVQITLRKDLKDSRNDSLRVNRLRVGNPKNPAPRP